MGTSVFALACLGVLVLLVESDNSWLSIKAGLSVVWGIQQEIWHSLFSGRIPVGYAISLAALIVILLIEHLYPWRKLQKRFRKEFWLDVIYNILSFGLMNILGLGLAYTLIIWPFDYILTNVFHTQYPLVHLIDEVPMWLRIILLIVCSEFVSYWAHRMEHQINFLWQFHKIHHSALELDVMNSQRLHWLELLWLSVTSYTVLGIIGFNAAEIALVAFFATFLCYFTHANVRIPIGKLKYIINSPQMHIWHHSIDIDPNQNVNYGGALSIWDWIYGTAYFPEETPGDIELGFEGVEDFPKTFIGQFFYPLRFYGAKVLQIFIVQQAVNEND